MIKLSFRKIYPNRYKRNVLRLFVQITYKIIGTVRLTSITWYFGLPIIEYNFDGESDLNNIKSKSRNAFCG